MPSRISSKEREGNSVSQVWLIPITRIRALRARAACEPAIAAACLVFPTVPAPALAEVRIASIIALITPFLITLTGVLLIVALLLILTRRLLKPLESLADSLRRFGKDRQVEPVTVRAKGKVGEALRA